VGSLTDSAEAARLASKYEQAHEDIGSSRRRGSSGRASHGGHASSASEPRPLPSTRRYRGSRTTR
jgi:hypothetical protein